MPKAAGPEPLGIAKFLYQSKMRVTMSTVDPSLWNYFSASSGIVKFVMLILFVASIVSWSMIFQRGFMLRRSRKLLAKFEDKFWSGIDLSKLYADLNRERDQHS